MFRHGQLPFWNQYIFSGTPLMADFNAGAFYPLMGLFVVLPDRAAWVATEVVLFSAIAVGMYVFLRALKLSTVACLLAAVTFAFAGPVLSQVNHVDMTEGFVAIPWMLLAVLHIVRDGRWRWTILLGVAYATVILAGAPEAMLDEAFLVIAFAALVGRPRPGAVVAGPHPVRRRSRPGAVAGGDPVAPRARGHQQLAARGAACRRGGRAASRARSPSSSLVPYIDGGYGHLGEAQFFGQYNLPEVGIYLGILPVIALITLLAPALAQPHCRPRPLTWYVVGALRAPAGAGVEHAAGAPLQQPAALRPPAAAEPQHDHRRHGASVSCSPAWIDRTEAPRTAEPLTWFDRIRAFVPSVVVAGLAMWAWRVAAHARLDVRRRRDAARESPTPSARRR